MKKLFFIVSFLYLLSIFSFVSNKILDSNNSSFGDFSLYLSNLFDRKYLRTKVRKSRSNSDERVEWKELDRSQHIFAEIPVLGVELENKESLERQIRRSDVSHDFQPLDQLLRHESNINRLKASAEDLFAITRNSFSNQSNKDLVLNKIIDEFKSNNLITFTQKFNTTSQESNGKTLKGVNVIGIIPGVHRNGDSSKDRLIVIGAHYDTVEKTNGVNDNGSGMTVLLEIIRLLHLNNCQITYSLFFIAFDLEEYGALGSKYFVNNHLIPNELNLKGSQFEGAIILDTLLNFNQTYGSQDIPFDVHKALPEWSRNIRENRFVGDFLAIISRNKIDDILSNQINGFWNSMSVQMPFKLSQMRITSLEAKIPDFKTLSNHANLLRSDHIMFWYHNNPHYNQTLRAVLLTDTGPFRGYMRDCYHNSCDDKNHLNEKNLRFLRLTAQVLTQTAVKLSLGKCLNV